MERTVEATALHMLRKKICGEFPIMMRECLGPLNEEQIWWRPDDKSNSIGNLVLHMVGSTRFYILHAIGGQESHRDRPKEFSERMVPRDELLQLFETAVKEFDEGLAKLAPSDLMVTTERTGKETTYFQILLHVALHLSVHTGQIMYLTKMIKPGTINELWVKARD